MLSYQQVDFIADAYIPILLVAALILIFHKVYLGELGKAKSASLKLIVSIAWIYGLMVVDNIFKIWPYFALDYSTHTALALALISFLLTQPYAAKTQQKRLMLCLSLIGYAALMLYQEYHSLSDIVTTCIVILPGLFLINGKIESPSKHTNH